ncbi:hypothetical protein [Dokdonella sp.]|uniref:hypothetical protein n=1 Tax=Dokdonella sp. TaxID=2291710 RepID=UPI0031BE5307|nr:hypothetical protein [Dokdonella sp.]
MAVRAAILVGSAQHLAAYVKPARRLLANLYPCTPLDCAAMPEKPPPPRSDLLRQELNALKDAAAGSAVHRAGGL